MILAIDCGSTNHKVALFDERLRRLARASRPVLYTVRTAERVEFDPEKTWRDTIELIREVCSAAQLTPHQIKTIALTSQANTFTLVNAADTPVTPFISWLDKRATEEAAELNRLLGAGFHKHCSFPHPSPQLQVSKLLWLSRHLPTTVRAGTRAMALPSFLAWRLAGLHCTDANLAAMSGMYSLQEQSWWTEGLAACGWAEKDCGQVVAPGEPVPVECQCIELNLSPELEIVFAGNDQTAGAFANGIRDGGLVLTLGTALVAYRFVGDEAGPYPAAGGWGIYPSGGFYELMARDEGCNALDWAVEQTMPGQEAEFFRLATTAPIGSASFFPQLMHTPDAWIGSPGIAAKARAVLEGISFSLRELVEGMAANRGAKEATSVIGGGSANPFWLAMLANVLNRPIRRGNGDNLLGAAMMARPAITPEPNNASDCFLPDADQVEEYERVFKSWQQHAAVAISA